MFINLRNISLGMGLIGWFFTILLAFILLLIITIGFYEGRKSYWDNRVTEMCSEDGGVKVFETIQVIQKEHPELISSSGNLIVPNLSNATLEDPYYIDFSESIIRKKNPRVRRTETKIIRRSDSKILSIRISYSRGGGDFPIIIAAPSSYSCRKIDGINTSLIKSTFSIKGV